MKTTPRQGAASPPQAVVKAPAHEISLLSGQRRTAPAGAARANAWTFADIRAAIAGTPARQAWIAAPPPL